MIIQETVLVTLNPLNIFHYESLGYFIPRYKDKFYRQKVKKGTQIEVKISDLMKGSSKVKVLCKCDICGKEKLIVFNTIKEKYICQKCTNNIPELIEKKSEKISGKNNKNWKGGLPYCNDCGKQLSSRRFKFCKSCSYKKRLGQNAPNWNFELTDIERKIGHKIPGINRWRKQVKERDNHNCQKCGSKENLHAHHINNFSDFKKQRIDVDNGITLCFNCHKGKNGIHSLFGSFTTLKRLKIFLKIKIPQDV